MKAEAVRLDRVTVAHGKVVALQDASLTIRAGETVVFLGPSGAGKSTLVRAVAGLEKLASGAVQTGRVGMVFQAFHLFPHLTVLDNITLAPRKVRGIAREPAEAKAQELLRRLRLGDQALKFPPQLSGGQQQRAAIARALAMEPEVMAFDEPTSALDPESVADVLDAVRDLAAQGMTLLVVTHQMGFAREVSDRVVFLDRGHIVEEAETERFFEAPASARARLFLERVLKY